jgi:cytochrome c biogenesis protein CcdA
MSKILYIGVRRMSYEEKGQWVYLAATTIGCGVYVVLMLGAAGTTPLTEVDYQPILLWTIGAAIAASIIGRILIEMITPSDSRSEDVRDRDIGRLGEYRAGLVLGIGMVVPFILALLEADQFWIANAMYLVFTVQAIVGAVIKLVAYRRGF